MDGESVSESLTSVIQMHSPPRNTARRMPASCRPPTAAPATEEEAQKNRH